jgi:hypothetical protein
MDVRQRGPGAEARLSLEARHGLNWQVLADSAAAAVLFCGMKIGPVSALKLPLEYRLNTA